MSITKKSWYNGLNSMGYEVWNITDTFEDAKQTLSKLYAKGTIDDGFVTVSFDSFEDHDLAFEVWVQTRK